MDEDVTDATDDIDAADEALKDVDVEGESDERQAMFDANLAAFKAKLTSMRAS